MLLICQGREVHSVAENYYDVPLRRPGCHGRQGGAGFALEACIVGQALGGVGQEIRQRRLRSREGRDDLLVIVACVLIGVGVGMLFGHAAAGALIGLGAGLLLETVWKQWKPPA